MNGRDRKRKVQFFVTDVCSLGIEISEDAYLSKRELRKKFNESPASAYAKNVGCYILVATHGRSVIPYYVGKTANSFRTEVTNVHIPERIEQIKTLRVKGSLGVIFVVLKSKQSRVSDCAKKVILELEKDLITSIAGKFGTGHLLNVNKINGLPYEIEDVTRKTVGQPAKNVAIFKKITDF